MHVSARSLIRRARDRRSAAAQQFEPLFAPAASLCFPSIPAKKSSFSSVKALRILIIEDQEHAPPICKKGLCENGFQIDTVSTGATVAPGKTEDFGFIVLDIALMQQLTARDRVGCALKAINLVCRGVQIQPPRDQHERLRRILTGHYGALSPLRHQREYERLVTRPPQVARI